MKIIAITGVTVVELPSDGRPVQWGGPKNLSPFFKPGEFYYPQDETELLTPSIFFDHRMGEHRGFAFTKEVEGVLGIPVRAYVEMQLEIGVQNKRLSTQAEKVWQLNDTVRALRATIHELSAPVPFWKRLFQRRSK